MLARSGDKFFATPLWANIQEGLASIGGAEDLPKTIGIVRMAQSVAQAMGGAAYLVLDAYFAVGPLFLAAAPPAGRRAGRQRRDGENLVNSTEAEIAHAKRS